MRRIVSGVALVAALVAGVAHPAAASTKVTATGSFGLNLLSITVTSAGQNTLADLVGQIPYSGDLSGLSDNTESDVAHSDGSYHGHGTNSCTACTLGGRAGGFTAVYEITGSNYFTTQAPFQGHLTFTGGTGGLAGLHGGGTFQGDASGNTSYSYTYFFAPRARLARALSADQHRLGYGGARAEVLRCAQRGRLLMTGYDRDPSSPCRPASPPRSSCGARTLQQQMQALRNTAQFLGKPTTRMRPARPITASLLAHWMNAIGASRS
jgi:hypothetical protein